VAGGLKPRGQATVIGWIREGWPPVEPAPAEPAPAEPAPPAEVLYLDPGPLKAGEYNTGASVPTTLTIPEGWETSGEQHGWFDLFEQGTPEDVSEGIVVWESTGAPVFDPSLSGEALKTERFAIAPDDFLPWLLEHPALQITADLQPVSVGGLSGSQIDAVVQAGNDWPDCPSGQSCLAIAPLLEGAFGFYEGDSLRAYVLDAGAGQGQVVIFVGAPGDAALEQMLQKADPIIQSLHFEPNS
jgi:hypothetical protein